MILNSARSYWYNQAQMIAHGIYSLSINLIEMQTGTATLEDS